MHKLRLIPLTVLGLLVLSVAPVGIAQGQATAVPAAGISRPTGIVVAAIDDPLRVTGSDGSDHLEYDLIVTNTFVAPVTLTSIEAIAPDGETLLRLDGEALVQATQPVFGQEPLREIPVSGTVAVVIDVVVPPARALERLTHHIVYDVAPDAPERSLIGSFAVDGPELAVDPRRATVIAPPLRGDGWLAGNGCCSPESGHRATRIGVDGARIVKPELFALDWIRLRDGRLFAGDGARREQWFAFGAEVLAVADGMVVAVREGIPEEEPNQPPRHVTQPEGYGGNFVTIELAPGVFAFYAHLQPGSVAVAVGDRVTTGQPIGRLGNTGNTTAPHLHFVLIDAPDPATSASLPMVFDRYTLEGAVPSAAFDAAATGAAEGSLIPEGTPREETATLPMDNTVIDFP